MANYAQTVNVIGAIKTTATEAELEPTGLVLALYRQHFGTLPVDGARARRRRSTSSAAWTADRSALTVAIVNPDAAGARPLRLERRRRAPEPGAAARFVLTGDGPARPQRPRAGRAASTVEETNAADAGEPRRARPAERHAAGARDRTSRPAEPAKAVKSASQRRAARRPPGKTM